MLLVTATAAAALLVATSGAFACTIFWGTNTIENVTTGAGPYTVVGDPHNDIQGQGMDRCEGAGSGGVFSADGSSDTIRIEIDEYSGSGCSTSNWGGAHSLVDAGISQVYVTAWVGDGDGDGTAGDAYVDTDGDGVYEDSKTTPDERLGDCMGDGTSSSDVQRLAGGTHGIHVVQSGSHAGQFDNQVSGVGDSDGDGVYDIEVDLSQLSPTLPASPSGQAGMICVGGASSNDSAPHIPLEIS